MEISGQVRTAEKQVVGTFEKCFARPSSHSESEIFQLFCRYVQTFLDIVADRSACATLSIWQFVQSVEDCLLHHSQTCCLCWMCHLKKCSNLLDDAKNNTWHIAATLIKKLKNKDNITQAELKQFYKEVESFVSATISKPLEKISVSTKIVRNACIFNPCLMSAIPVDVFIKRIKILIGYLVDGDWVEAHVWNKMITLFSLFIASSYTNFSSFKQKKYAFWWVLFWKVLD